MVEYTLMSTGETNFDYELSLPEQRNLLRHMAKIAIDLLGEPNPESARDIKERRLRDGQFARMTRTIIEVDENPVGIHNEMDIFVPERLVYKASGEDEEEFSPGYMDESDDESTEDTLRYEGRSYTLSTDHFRNTIFKSEGIGQLCVNAFGDSRIEISEYYQSRVDVDFSQLSEIDEMVSPSSKPFASDYLRVIDATKLLRGTK